MHVGEIIDMIRDGGLLVICMIGQFIPAPHIATQKSKRRDV